MTGVDRPTGRRPVETKVVTGTAGGGFGAVLAPAGVWALGVLAFGAPADAGSASAAIAAVPWPLEGLLTVLLTAAGAFVGGWLGNPTDRSAT